MFASDVSSLDATATLNAAAEAHARRTQAEIDLIEVFLHFADLHPDPATIPGHESLPGGERGWVNGGPGCPGVAEFALAELGAVIGRSAGSAACFMGQSLALRHRLPRIWAKVKSGYGEPWKARTIATACLALSVEAAAIVDRRVAGIIDTVTPVRLDKIVKAAVQQADPEAARATAEARAKERGVWAGQVDEHGSTVLTLRAATGDVIRFKTTIRQLADALAELGDTGTLQQRKARAVGIISDPALTHHLLSVAHHLTPAASRPSDPENDSPPASPAPHERTAPTDPGDPTEPADSAEPAERTDPGDRTEPADTSDPAERTEPTEPADLADPRTDAAARRNLAAKLATLKRDAYSQGIGATGRRPAQPTLYVHITDETLLAGGGVARVERFGPVFAALLEELLGHDRINVTPVIDLNDKLSVDAYEIPRRVRERIKLTHPVEQFPYGCAETTDSTDLDHLKPYDFADSGPPRQTSTTNLAPLRRYSHRVKTHGGWAVRRLDDGTLEWTTRHGFRFLVDHTGTHRLRDDPGG
ncbi:hypothetical protein GCM10009789_73300 [Kribbella sancticallisti]|uniref:DUF222 domain-containing protein n=1 Tax=Kribbella sancticallisti TaxID=460087 RepID=A0ABN2EKV9_9ACTN